MGLGQGLSWRTLPDVTWEKDLSVFITRPLELDTGSLDLILRVGAREQRLEKGMESERVKQRIPSVGFPVWLSVRITSHVLQIQIPWLYLQNQLPGGRT